MGQNEVRKILKGRDVGKAVNPHRVVQLEAVGETEVQTSAFHVDRDRILVAGITERETRAAREGLFWLLDHIVAETRRGDVVEFDVLHAVEATFIAHIPRFRTRKIVRVVDTGLELVGGLHAVGHLAVIGGVKLQRVLRPGERRAERETRGELLFVAGLAREVDRRLVSPAALKCRDGRVLATGRPTGRDFNHRGGDDAIGARNLHGACVARNFSIDARAAREAHRHGSIGRDRRHFALLDSDRAGVVRGDHHRTALNLGNFADNPRTTLRLNHVSRQIRRTKNGDEEGEGSPEALDFVHQRECDGSCR